MEPTSRRGKRRHTVLPEITLTPLIDTALTLLIIFMVTAPMLNNAIRVDLPKGKAQEANSHKQELTVFIDKQGRLYLNGVQNKDVKDLLASIKKQVGKHTNTTVCVKGDQGITYGQVFELVDSIKVVGGVSYVVLASQRA